jgi:hypothetical protein
VQAEHAPEPLFVLIFLQGDIAGNCGTLGCWLVQQAASHFLCFLGLWRIFKLRMQL